MTIHAPQGRCFFFVKTLVFIGAVLILGSGHVDAHHKEVDANGAPLVFGVFPYLPADRLEAAFAPVAAELGKALNRRILYRSASTYEGFMKRLAREEFDIAFIQPFDYVRIAAEGRYLPAAKGREQLFGLFVVREESPYAALSDLKGAVIAMAPKVASMSYLGKKTLLDAGFDLHKELTIQYMRSYHSCLLQLAIGRADACVTSPPALRIFEAAMGLRLRIVAATPPIPQMLFVVHVRVPEEYRQVIQKTLLATTLEGVAPALRALLCEDGERPFVAATDAEYDIVRRYWQALRDK